MQDTEVLTQESQSITGCVGATLWSSWDCGKLLHNPDFKRINFDAFKQDAGTNAFVFYIKKWQQDLGTIGLITKSGRYGDGIYAHSDIALEFASWISPEFKLYIIKDYKRLKNDENSRLSLNWNLNREVAKLNYRIHTDAIKGNLLPLELTQEQIAYTYASEADMLNMALFGKTAKQWRDANLKKNAICVMMPMFSNFWCWRTWKAIMPY